MQRAMITGAAMLMTLSSAAFAQTNSAPIANSAATAPTKMAAQATETDRTALAGKGGMFTTIPARDDLSSQVIGLDVYNSSKQDIGKIKDVAFNANGVEAYILGVGGFLSMGDHYVAVRPSAMTLSYDATAKQWHAMMDANADELKAAPEYKYSSDL